MGMDAGIIDDGTHFEETKNNAHVRQVIGSQSVFIRIFGETTISHTKIWNPSIEPTSKKWLFYQLSVGSHNST